MRRRPVGWSLRGNPNCLYQHHQSKWSWKPFSIKHPRALPESLEKLGINPLEHDIRFVEDNWETHQLFSWSWLGSLAWWDGIPPLYFHRCGLAIIPDCGSDLFEKAWLYIQEVDSAPDIEWLIEDERSLSSLRMSNQIFIWNFWTKRCCLKTISLKKKLAAHWKKAWFTLPMTMFSNVHTPLTCLTRGAASVTERAGYNPYPPWVCVVAKTFVAGRKLG